jgi:hypothetical protein
MENREGAKLKAKLTFAPTEPHEVFGILRYDGPAKTLEEMDGAITEEVRRRHARGYFCP